MEVTLTVGTTERAKAPGNDRDVRERICVAGECIWEAAREHRSFENVTPHGRLMSAYLRDLTGLCACPRHRVSRRV